MCEQRSPSPESHDRDRPDRSTAGDRRTQSRGVAGAVRAAPATEWQNDSIEWDEV
jgi:hypothetical protein